MKKLFFGLIVFLLLPSICALPKGEIKEGMNIELEIKNYGTLSDFSKIIPEEYHIMGDFFYYTIFFEANEDIKDRIFVNIALPSGESIHSIDFPLELKKGQNYSYTPKSVKGEGTRIGIPFSSAGDYKVKICSENKNTFYRWYLKMYTENSGEKVPLFESQCTHFFFDVITQTKYNLEKNQDRYIESNKEQGEIMIDLTRWIIFLTIVMIASGFMQLFSTKEGKRTFAKSLLLLNGLFILTFSGFSFWIALNTSDFLIKPIGFISGIIFLLWGIKEMCKVKDKKI